MSGNTTMPVVVGVDVGGTNTDAVLISQEDSKHQIISAVKELTSGDITTGVQNAVNSALHKAYNTGLSFGVIQVNIGTTHFINAAVQGKGLAKVCVLRLCGSVSQALPPFSDFPEKLRKTIFGSVHLLGGGYRFDGREIDPVDRREIVRIVEKLKQDQISCIVVIGVFSPIRNQQEILVRDIIKETHPEASVTLSHEIGHIGLLERENAAILNECLKPLCKKTIRGFQNALKEIGLKCPIYLTQNDGTIISSDEALRHPVHTFASGPTNSMRGAAFLTDIKEAIVIDIGGTTSDVGVLKNSFPREASTQVKIGGVRTNFRMPDVLSIGLGGGSYVEEDNRRQLSVTVGPLSAGYNLYNEAMVFGNGRGDKERRLTATDIAVAAGLCTLGKQENVRFLSKAFISATLDKITQMIEDCIDKVKLQDQSLPVILVGGGSILVDPKRPIKGARQVIIPEHFGVANAIGAALSQISGRADHVYKLLDMVDKDKMANDVKKAIEMVTDDPDGKETEIAKENAQKPFFVEARDRAFIETGAKATEIAVNAGADPSSIEIADKQDITLSYIPGQAIQIKVKAVGNLTDWRNRKLDLDKWQPSDQEHVAFTSDRNTYSDSKPLENKSTDQQSRHTTDIHKSMHAKQSITSRGTKLVDDMSDEDPTKKPIEPNIDLNTGEWILSEWDIECIVVGAGIFGCGGGGSPHLARLRALKAIRSGKKIRIMTPERLLKNADPENDLVVIVAFMGAPLIMFEQLVSSKETSGSLKCMEDLFKIGQYRDRTLGNQEGVEIKTRAGMSFIDDYRPTSQSTSYSPSIGQKAIKALMAAEIGGMNAIEPFLVAADLGLPVVDADGMGRAFPEIQMFAPYMYGVPPYPAVLMDDKKRRAVMLDSPSAKQLEHYLRDIVVEMGCSGGLVLTPLVKRDIMEKSVLHSVSHAWRLGNAILKARLKKSSPVEAILETEKSIHVITGKIKDVQRETTGGFNKGRVIIEGIDTYSGQKVLIEFQNENLVIIPLDEENKQGDVIACVPDLITIVDADTGEPIPTEDVRYGTRVSVLVLASPPILRTETALRFVGPQAFKYPENVRFVPFGDANETVPIPPK